MLTRHIVGIQILSNYTVFLKLICQLYLKKKKRENTLIFLPCDPLSAFHLPQANYLEFPLTSLT